MGLRIDFALEQARGALDRELATSRRRLSRARVLSSAHLLVRLREQALRLGRGSALGFIDHFVRALARLIEDLRGAFARLADDLLGALGLRSQVLLALLGGGQDRRRSSASALPSRPMIIGHTNFIVAQMSTKNTIICTISVRLMFTFDSLPACAVRSGSSRG